MDQHNVYSTAFDSVFLINIHKLHVVGRLLAKKRLSDKKRRHLLDMAEAALVDLLRTILMSPNGLELVETLRGNLHLLPTVQSMTYGDDHNLAVMMVHLYRFALDPTLLSEDRAQILIDEIDHEFVPTAKARQQKWTLRSLFDPIPPSPNAGWLPSFPKARVPAFAMTEEEKNMEHSLPAPLKFIDLAWNGPLRT